MSQDIEWTIPFDEEGDIEVLNVEPVEEG